MATLNGGITSTAELVRVSGTPPAPGTYFTIDDEAMKVNGATRGAQGRNFTRDYLAVDRGVAGTTKVTHSNGSTLTPYYPDAPGSDSGGVIDATDGQIVFMDGTDAVGSAHLTWDASTDGTLGLVDRTNGHALIKTIGAGVELSLQASDGDDTAPTGPGTFAWIGGEVEVIAGNGSGANGSGGAITIKAGTGQGGGGPITIRSGNSSEGASGDIDIRVDPAGPSAIGGNINIVAGAGATGDGGDVLIQAGPKVTGGSHGSVQLYDGSSNNGLELNASGLFYFGAAPQVPASPTVQDVVDALVAIGFITQAS